MSCGINLNRCRKYPIITTVMIMGRMPLMKDGKTTKIFSAILIFSLIGGVVGVIFVIPQQLYQPRLQIYSARFTGDMDFHGHRIIEVTIINNDVRDYEMVEIYVNIDEEETRDGSVGSSGISQTWNRSGILAAGEKDTREFAEPDPYNSDEEGRFYLVVSIGIYEGEEMDSQRIPYSYEPDRYLGIGIVLILVSSGSCAVLATVFIKESSKTKESKR